MKPLRVKGPEFTSKDVLDGLVRQPNNHRKAVRTSVDFITTIMGQSKASAMMALGLVKASKYAREWEEDLHPRAEDGKFTESGGEGRPKGVSVSEQQAEVERQALAYIKEEFLSKGRSFADPDEYKEMKANIWDWKHVWQESVEQRMGQTFTGSGDTYMPGKSIGRLDTDTVKAVMAKNGIDYPDVKVVDNLGEATVGGRKFVVDGMFDPNSKTVFVGSHLSKEEVVGILKHEVQHARTDAVWGKISGAIDAMKPELMRTGRVTEYASDWWDGVKAGTAKYHDAVDETLAEIATLSAKQYDKLDANWKNLYTMTTELQKAK